MDKNKKQTNVEEITLTEKEMNQKIKEMKRNKIIKVLKKSSAYIGILFSTLILTITCFVLCNDFKNDFIAPTSNEIYGQDEELYIVSTYLQTDDSSKTFVKELRKLKKNYDIPYYLVDLAEYEELVDIWQLEYSPTYFVIHQNGAKKELLYKSYGAKKYNVLNAEIEYCILNGGVPIDHRGNEHIDETTGLKIVLDTVESTTSGNIEVKFTITNTKPEDVIFDYSFVKAYKYGTTNTGNNLSSDTQITIHANESKEVTLTFSGVEALKVKLTINLSSINGNSYSWIINKLNYTIDLDD